MHPSRNDIGAYISCNHGLIDPISWDAASDLNGASVDRQGYSSAVALASAGAETGGPTSKTLVFQLEESSDNSTWTEVSGATITITADSTPGELNLDLSARKRYIRLIADASASSFTGGTSPECPVSGRIVLGGARDL